MTSNAPGVIGGVDTHKDTHDAAVLDQAGRLLDDRQFTATAAGHQELLAWLLTHGDVHAVGIEGTGSYGAALTRVLSGQKSPVIEINRPNRHTRRTDGKSDRLDAEQAARAVLGQVATATPKAKTGAVEVIACCDCPAVLP